MKKKVPFLHAVTGLLLILCASQSYAEPTRSLESESRLNYQQKSSAQSNFSSTAKDPRCGTPKDRAYIILFRYDEFDPENEGELIIPIASRSQAFPGMPVAFGGAIEGSEKNIQTIIRELKEESKGKIRLIKAKKKPVHIGTVNGAKYSFYSSVNFTVKGALESIRSQEVSHVVTFKIRRGERENVSDMMKDLRIKPTKAFAKSETIEAYQKALNYDWWRNYSTNPPLDSATR